MEIDAEVPNRGATRAAVVNASVAAKDLPDNVRTEVAGVGWLHRPPAVIDAENAPLFGHTHAAIGYRTDISSSLCILFKFQVLEY